MAYQDPRWGGGKYYPPEDPPEDQYSREAEYAPPPGPPPTSDYGQEGYYQRPPGPPPGPFQGNLGYAPPQFPPPGIRPPPSPSPQEFTHQYRPDGQAGGPMAIPTYAQNFHQQLPQYQFQYSQCTGRRKALLIGINYIGTQNQLKGCINDVLNIKHFIIQRFGFREEDMVILTDDAQNPASRPTKQNMARAMQWLVQGARPQDSLFFHYSGHGGQSVDWNSEQDDVYDEVIYPVDFKEAGSLSNIVYALEICGADV
jgi:metacaspase-1